MGLIESLSVDNRQRLEAIATKQRNILDFKAFEPLPPEVLIKHFQATLFTAEAVPNAKLEAIKLLNNNDDWSAGIISLDPLWIVYNLRHTTARQQSDLMHEFAHIILKHEMVKYDSQTGLPQRLQKYEDEAVYLGGCLQIPRRGLLWSIQKKMTTSQVALHFNASEEMVKFRSNVSGLPLNY